jgi:hypothetical protein
MPVPTTKVNLTQSGFYQSIPYVELYAPQEQWQENDCSATRRLACPWTSRQQFVTNMVGVAVTNGTRSSGLTRITPASMLSGFDSRYEVPYNFSSGIDYSTEIMASFNKWHAVSAKLVEGRGLPLQGQTSGELTYANKPLLEMTAGTDYDAATGQLLGTRFTWNGTGVGYGVGDAVYDVTYRPLPFDVRPDNDPLGGTGMDQLPAPLDTCELGRYVQRYYQFGARVLAFPAGTTYFKDQLQANPSTAVPIPEGAGLKVLPYGTWQYKWHHVPTIPWSNIWACYGKVNSSETGVGAPDGRFDYIPSVGGTDWVNGKQQGWLPKTLLFEGVSGLEQVISAAGQRLWNITYAFRYLPGNNGNTQDTHNKIYRFTDNDFYEVVTNYTPGKVEANWKPIYESATFTNLFKLSFFA